MSTLCNADIPVCGFTGHSCPVVAGDWKVATTRRLESLRHRDCAMKFFHLIWCNLRRKKLRTSLTLLSIIVAFILFGFLSAIQQALVGGVALAGADRLIVREKVSIINLLPVSYEARIDRIPGVDFSTHQTWFGGIYQDPKNFFMQNPVEPEKFLKMHPEIILPPDEEKAWLATRTGAIVGRRTAERFGWKIGDKVPIQSTIWPLPDGSQTWTFDIVGIFDGKDKGTDTTPMFFRYDYFDEARQPVGQRARSAGTPSASRTRRRRRKWPGGWTPNLKIHRRKPRRSRKARLFKAGPAKLATSSSSSRRF